MKNHTKKTECDLILKIKAGDTQAFTELLRLYNARVYGYFLRTFGQHELAQDLFQETFLRVWRSFDRFDPNKNFATWVFTIAERVCIDTLRSRSNRRSVMVDSSDFDCPGDENPESEYRQKELKQEIAGFVRTLPIKQRRVFLLRQQGELPFKEIARVMNEPLNSVLSHMNYAVKKLKKHLKVHNET